MNRIITILVTIFILLLLYIWISHVWGSENPRHPRQIVQTSQDEALGADDSTADLDTSTMSNSLSDQLLDDSPAETPVTEQKIEEVNVEEVEKPKETPKVEPKKQMVTEEKKPEPKKTETKPKTTTTTPAKPAPPPATKTSQPMDTKVVSSTGGKHLVIAGNFLQRENANQRMQELKKAGFGETEVVNFDLSEYHTVCAGRFDDVNEARRLVKKLKDYHKIDAYVRIGS